MPTYILWCRINRCSWIFGVLVMVMDCPLIGYYGHVHVHVYSLSKLVKVFPTCMDVLAELREGVSNTALSHMTLLAVELFHVAAIVYTMYNHPSCTLRTLHVLLWLFLILQWVQWLDNDEATEDGWDGEAGRGTGLTEGHLCGGLPSRQAVW